MKCSIQYVLLLASMCLFAGGTQAQVMIGGAKEKDPFTLLRERPLFESVILIPQLMAGANTLSPPYLYELARRLWPSDKSGAMEWFALAMVRARYDAFRCVDATARQGINYLPQIAPEVVTGIESDRKAFGDAGRRALARSDVFVDSISPIWICSHGMATINSALQGRPLAERDWLRPSSEWDSIRSEVRSELEKYFIAQGQSQDDPIPMTQAKLPRIRVPAGALGRYAWLDSQRLVAASSEKDQENKFLTRLAIYSADGRREEVATISAPFIWCAGNGVIMHQTAVEKLPSNAQRVTLATGLPGNWSAQTRELRPPFPAFSGSQGAGFSAPGMGPSRQSPFDCRWETNEELSGPKGMNQWFPLLAGDGLIRMDGFGASRKLQWVNSKGESINLAIDATHVTIGSFRHLPWKDSYFVSPTWSRFTHKEKTLPTCITAAYIHPKQGRVEEVCVPFDSGNTANPVMFSPSRVGWLRATGARNTPHGMKTGGLYLVRSDGKTEKLLDATVSSWALSPDGCRVAVEHFEPPNAISVVDIVGLCQP